MLLPEEKFKEQWHCDLRLLESKWCKRLFLLMPLLVVILIPLMGRFLLWFLFLHPVESTIQWSHLFQSKAIVLSLGVIVIPVLWWCGLKLEKTKQRKLWAVVLIILFVTAVNMLFTSSKVRWTFVEWAKVRTPNPSFARNTLFWEQRNFERRSQRSLKPNRQQVHLIGSSQTFQATDLQLLRDETEDYYFEKNCLAGFGPMQYQFLWSRISERNPDIIVCWLSEFDFYREEKLPTSRLRWGSSFEGIITLSQQCDTKIVWDSREELADLIIAASLPVCRNRDHIKRAMLNYWWDRSRPLGVETQQVEVLAKSVGLEDARIHLKNNVTRSRLLDVNFRCFQQFALRCKDANIKLIVFEGQSHPQAITSYDANFKKETRDRLTAMSQLCGFQYHAAFKIPKFTQKEFADAYHLNEQGRIRWSKFLAKILNKQKDKQL